MDAKRLEELVYRCNEASEDISNGFGAYFDSHDIADLARCAKAWAKVEREKPECLCFSPRKSYWTVDRGATTHDSAIEAVEGMK